MKLIIAIVNNDDAHYVNTGLSKAGYFVTKISSTGGFLMNGNTTFLMGVNDDQVENAVEIIKHHSKKRVHNIPMDMLPSSPGATQPSVKVTVGGATVFIMNIEDCRHL
ncbi:MAG: cyclic-di-AMP receptor [Clostridia bacterium]|nr:cyclic-di-AMP receptor [Clostridia bacterium]